MTTGEPDRPLNVAFADITNPGWTAGAHYYTNLFRALHHLEGSDRPRVTVLLPPREADGYDTFQDLADDVLRLPSQPRARFLRRQVERAGRRLGIGGRPSAPVERVLHEQHVDAVFAPAWTSWDDTFGLPLLAWIPDFFHEHYPEYFVSRDVYLPTRRFAATAASCSRIIVSSEDAVSRDCEQFIPSSAHKARVLRFVAEVPADVYDDDPADVCTEYGLPERFVYLPNQFWAHKNHGVVVDALAELRSSRPEITVVCTGNPADRRDPLFFGTLLAQVSRRGVRDRFIVLGWVPHRDTFRLLRQSVAALQPSLFEGWSTTVEEAKSIGKATLLSDIPIHREQAPAAALYFDPGDPAQLAERLIEAYDTLEPGPDERLEQRAREDLPTRTRAYAETFIGIVREAIA